MAGNKPLTINLPEKQLRELEQLAESDQRSSADVAAEAVAEYLEYQKWKDEAVEAGLAALRRGEAAPHEEVAAWLQGWGTDHELPRPSAKPRV